MEAIIRQEGQRFLLEFPAMDPTDITEFCHDYDSLR